MHIPDDPLYYEKFYFTPGDLGFKAWQTKYAKIGVLICWDQWYPEAARLTAMQGAEILFYPTAIGWHPGEKEKYGASSTARGKPSSAAMPSPTAAMSPWPTASATKILDGVGGDGIEFWGQSFVAGTSGEILAKADSRTRKKFSSCPWTSPTWTPRARTGRSCATAGLTPTEI